MLKAKVRLLDVYIFIVIVNAIDGGTDLGLKPKSDSLLTQLTNKPVHISLSIWALVKDAVQVLRAEETVFVVVKQMESEPELVLETHLENTIDSLIEILIPNTSFVRHKVLDDLLRN